MKRLLLLGLGLAAFGCGEPPSVQPETSAVLTTAAKPAAAIEIPDFEKSSELGLRKSAGLTLRVGAAADEVFTNIFAAPPRSWPQTDLPPSIPAQQFEARGWQTKDEGFGVINYQGRVAAAVYLADRVSEDRVQELLKLQQDANGEPTALQPGKHIRFWFWKSPETSRDQVLMVCATKFHGEKENVTVAIGTQPVMAALGMTPELASASQNQAERMIESQKAKEKTNPSIPRPSAWLNTYLELLLTRGGGARQYE